MARRSHATAAQNLINCNDIRVASEFVFSEYAPMRSLSSFVYLELGLVLG